MKNLKKIKLGDLVAFKQIYESLGVEYCIGFVQAMNDEYFTISQYKERVR